MTGIADAFVAVDQGGHATRALAYDAAGRLLAACSQPVQTIHTATGGVEHDGGEIVASVREALAGLARDVPTLRWRAAGLAVQRSTVGCWDRVTGALLAPVISWQDRRQAAWLEGLSASATRVHQLTGLPLSPHYGACKLRWCLDHVDAVQAAHSQGRLCAGPLASLLMARLLAGRPFVCDEANASRTQLFSPQDRRWSAELLDLFGVPADVLPALLPTCDGFGTLQAGEDSVPLVVCTGDQSAVPFAAGPLDPQAAYVNLGTGAFVLRPVDAAPRAAPLLASVLASDATRVDYVLEGTVNGAGSAFDWLARQEDVAVESLLALLERPASPDAESALFLNGVSGLGSPFWRPDFPSRFVGAATRAGRARAVAESIAFLLAVNLEAMQAHAGPPARIVASGGLSQCGFLLDALAALSGTPVERVEDGEATARGLAWLVAGRPAGWQPPPMATFRPRPQPALEARYQRWRRELALAMAA